MSRRLRPARFAMAAVLTCAGSACVDCAGVQVADVEELAVIDRPGIAGRDGGASVVRDGNSVWIFGDTVLREADVDGLTWHHNSFSIAGLDTPKDADAFSEPLDPAGAPLHLLEPNEEERAFNLAHQDFGEGCDEEPCGARFATWPGTSVVDAERGRVLVFYGKIYAEPGAWNFESRGSGIAEWKDGDERPTRGDVQFDEDEPMLAAGATVIDDDAVALSCESNGMAVPCKLMRAPLADALDRDAWRFWNGSEWVRDPKSAVHVVDAAPITTLRWNEHLQRFTLVYSAAFAKDVMIRTAERVEGPWSGESLLFTTETHHEDDNPYDAYVHAEYDDSGRTLLVSYTRPNGEFLGSEMVLVRVTLADRSDRP